MGNTWVPRVPYFSVKILAHVTYQANPCQCLPPTLTQSHGEKELHPRAHPGAGKWDLAHRLCRSRTSGGQNGGMNCMFLALCGPITQDTNECLVNYTRSVIII